MGLRIVFEPSQLSHGRLWLHRLCRLWRGLNSITKESHSRARTFLYVFALRFVQYLYT